MRHGKNDIIAGLYRRKIRRRDSAQLLLFAYRIAPIIINIILLLFYSEFEPISFLLFF